MALRRLADGRLVLVRSARADARPRFGERRVTGVELLHGGLSGRARFIVHPPRRWRAFRPAVRPGAVAASWGPARWSLHTLRVSPGPACYIRTHGPRTDLWLAEPHRRARRRRALRGAREAREGPGEGARASASLPWPSGATPSSGQRKLEKEGVAIPPDRPSSRVRALVWLARRLGSAAVVPMVLETEAGDADKYDAAGRRGAARSPTRSARTAGRSSA